MGMRKKVYFLMVLLAGGLSSCATVPDSLVASPNVDLRAVQVVGLGFKNQTFLLSFEVANPNPFPLPIENVAYSLELDGQRFASGQTASEFTVPANGDTSFAISVELDLLRTSPQLLSIARSAGSRDIDYELQGQFALDLPYAPTVRYSESGRVRLNGNGY